MENTKKTMQDVLLDLFIDLGELAKQNLISENGSKQWYEYYCQCADRERVLREENDALRAKIAELTTTDNAEEATENEDHK